MAKKYILREGFVATIIAIASDGSKHDKTYVGGDTFELEDDVAAMHAHKLEFAEKKDRDAALKAEQAQKAASMGNTDTAALIQQLVGALAAAQKQVQAPAQTAAE